MLNFRCWFLQCALPYPLGMSLQLDFGSYQDCVGGRDSYANLSTGSHNFNVWANMSSGSYLSTVYRWTVGMTITL